jgi:hypothetical protein
MIINVIKEHINYPLGIHEVSEERGKYLISMGVAEEAQPVEKVEIKPAKEKVEFTPQKEKVTRKRTKK